MSRLNAATRTLLEGHFGSVWIAGEISNLARPRSGHWYFSLKDDGAQVRAAMFRGNNRNLDFAPRDGQQVLAHARVSLYAPRGDYQLIVEFMEELGSGQLRRAFDMLKAKLQAQGLFAAERKQPIPVLPRCIGIITSPTGAAVRDLLSVLARRFPAIPVRQYPTAVQGSGAAPGIVAALMRADREALADVLILARGGGSLEDLWAFNEESVAQAIARCEIPIISGIGHETDFTIADFVADIRAPTPSAAAEMAVPEQQEMLANIKHLQARLSRTMGRQLQRERERCVHLGKRLRNPRDSLRDAAQHADHLQIRLVNAMLARLASIRVRADSGLAKLGAQAPDAQLALHKLTLETLISRLHSAQNERLRTWTTRVSMCRRTLQATGPQPTLARGYAIITRPSRARVVDSVTQVESGDTLNATLKDGRLTVEVKAAIPR